LGISHERGFFRVHVGCERSGELRLVGTKSRLAAAVSAVRARPAAGP
jgi:hypothetical protein